MPDDAPINQVLELRVHGVSNTPPAHMLRERGLPDDPDPELVAGDEQTGFYRRRRRDDRAPLVTEAYSWGQLTSGRRVQRKDVERAAWALLLPFALVNVALWARHDVSPTADRRARTSAYVVRVLAVSLTVTLVLAVAGIAMDQVAWQCRDEPACREVPGTGVLRSADGWWGEGVRRVAVAALVPLAAVAGLWLLARRSFAYEAELPATTPGPARAYAGEPSPLEDPDFWRGSEQVRRLAALHVAAAVAAVSGLALAAEWGAEPARDGVAVDGLRLAVLAAVVVAIGGVLVAVGTPGVRDRGATTGTPYDAASRVAPGAAAASVVLAAVLLLGDGRELDAVGPLPGYADVVRWLFVAQLVAVVLLVALCHGWSWVAWVATATVALGAVAVWAGPGDARPGAAFLAALAVGALLCLVPLLAGARTGSRGETRTGSQEEARDLDPAWRGHGAALLAGAGWATASLYSAGVLFWVAAWLDAGASGTGGASTIELPPALLWAATGLPVAGVLALVVLGWVVRRLGRLATDATLLVQQERRIGGDADGAHERARAAQVARWRARHRFVGLEALTLVGWCAVGTLALFVVGVAGALTGLSPAELTARELTAVPWADDVVSGITDAGGGAASLVLVGLAALIGLAYRSHAPRQVVGIVWDVATFWPRGAHPFAPPCYAERVVPHLLTRTSGQLPSYGLLLAGHSQGAVIAAATVAQLPEGCRRRTYLLTFGTQLTRLYGRVFPAVFGPQQRRRLASLLGGEDGPRWTSLHRSTDPLGWHIVDPPVDVDVLDPVALAPTGGEVLDPPIHQHSDYPCAEKYLSERRKAMTALGIPAYLLPVIPSSVPAEPVERCGCAVPRARTRQRQEAPTG